MLAYNLKSFHDLKFPYKTVQEDFSKKFSTIISGALHKRPTQTLKPFLTIKAIRLDQKFQKHHICTYPGPLP